ncbi:hypothetical protein E2320_000785 [Naja naja]|nr:hypothetical protein E2320_000785 [Naja naja]
MDSSTLPGASKIYRRKSRRHMTCPNPREINQALACISLGELNRSCTLEELIEKCLRSFDVDGKLCTSDFMVNMTLTVHSWVVPVNHTWNRSLSCQHSPAGGKKRKVSLLFDHLDPGELAGHLSYLEFKAFCRLSYLDFQNYVLHGSVHGISALERAITLFNSISQWVQVMILKRPTPQQRAEVFTKFIHVTQKLRQLQNFNTLMAIVGGLCHSTIARLKETHALLPSEVVKVLGEMTELLSSSGNYGAYRRAYADCKDFKIPIVGVHLKDLVTLHEALPDRVEGGRLNLSKLQSLYEPVWEFRMRQQDQPPFEANKDLVHLLTLSLDLYYSEEEIYALSYSREPRCLKMLLWGVSKQGYRCRDCAMICHKHCKNQVEERDRLLTANQSLQNRYTQLEAENRRLLKTGSPASLYEITPRFI